MCLRSQSSFLRTSEYAQQAHYDGPVSNEIKCRLLKRRAIVRRLTQKMAIAVTSLGIEFPGRELAYAPIKSEVGEKYLGAMRAAINCALAQAAAPSLSRDRYRTTASKQSDYSQLVFTGSQISAGDRVTESFPGNATRATVMETEVTHLKKACSAHTVRAISSTLRFSLRFVRFLKLILLSVSHMSRPPFDRLAFAAL